MVQMPKQLLFNVNFTLDLLQWRPRLKNKMVHKVFLFFFNVRRLWYIDSVFLGQNDEGKQEKD